jgi:glutathionyl-hydroquinone reductase
LKTKVGQEPTIIVVLVDDSTRNKFFIVGDTMELTEADTSVQALLLLFTAYYLMDLNCPNQPVQMLRPVQQLCLNIDSLESQRSTSYMQFKEGH